MKAVTKDNAEEFYTILRRAFLVGLSLADNSLLLIKENKMKELKNLVSLEKTNNQLTNYCERIIHKGIFQGKENLYFLYVIVWNLEKVVDDYKYIVQELSEKDITLKKEVLVLFETVNNHFRTYYELFYKFDDKKLSELSNKRKDIQKNITELFGKTKGCDSIVMSYLYTILMKCEDFSASMFMLRHK